MDKPVAARAGPTPSRISGLYGPQKPSPRGTPQARMGAAAAASISQLTFMFVGGMVGARGKRPARCKDPSQQAVSKPRASSYEATASWAMPTNPNTGSVPNAVRFDAPKATTVAELVGTAGAVYSIIFQNR